MKVFFTLLFAGLQFTSVNAQVSGSSVSADVYSALNNKSSLYTADISGKEPDLYHLEIAGLYYYESNRAESGIFESTGNGFSMDQNTPNPCNEFTGVRYFIPAAGEIEFRIFNLIGKEVYRSLLSAEQGNNEFRLDSREFTQGVYMYTMTYNGVTISKRMVISRK